jgi:hypothetical protein
VFDVAKKPGWARLVELLILDLSLVYYTVTSIFLHVFALAVKHNSQITLAKVL